MPDRLLALFPVGHPLDDDYAGWLRQRLEYAQMEVDHLTVEGVGEARGHWAGMPCQARHLDGTEDGSLLLTFALRDFETAMGLPLVSGYELPPPLATFADACRALRPGVARLVAEPLEENKLEQYAVDAEEQTAEGPSGEVFDHPFTALFLSSFHLVMLEDELPLLAELRRLDIAGGAVFFAPGLALADSPLVHVGNDDET